MDIQAITIPATQIILEEMGQPAHVRSVCCFEPYSLWAVAHICERLAASHNADAIARGIEEVMLERRPVDWAMMDLLPAFGVVFCAESAIYHLGLGDGPVRDEDFSDRLRLVESAKALKGKIEESSETIDQAKRRLTALMGHGATLEMKDARTIGALSLACVRAKENWS